MEARHAGSAVLCAARIKGAAVLAAHEIAQEKVQFALKGRLKSAKNEISARRGVDKECEMVGHKEFGLFLDNADPVFRADKSFWRFRPRKTGICGWSTRGSDAAKVVLLGEVLKLRWRGPTPPLRVTCGERGASTSSSHQRAATVTRHATVGRARRRCISLRGH